MWRLMFAVTVAAAVAVPATAMAETAGPTLASTITDSRVDESSSLAVSTTMPGIGYTANDENDPIYAVEIGTGRVVGTARLMTAETKMKRVVTHAPKAKYAAKSIPCVTKKQRKKKCQKVVTQVAVNELSKARLVDPEAMSTDAAGRVWLADLGDNDQDRKDTALYAFDEQGLGDKEIVATRYPISYPGGQSFNVETLLINPLTDAKYLVTKTDDGTPGNLFALPATLRTDAPNVPTDVGMNMPAAVSDGDFTPRATRVILRDGTPGSQRAFVLDAANWRTLGTVTVPNDDDGKGESVSFLGTRFLTSREAGDDDTPLHWVPFDESTWTASTR